MPIKNFLKNMKSRVKQTLFIQLAVVILAFALMVILSSYYMGSIVSKHLVNNVESALESTQHNIENDMLELEVLLRSISETIRIMILHGESFDVVSNFITGFTNYIHTDDRLMGPYAGIYAVFDAYDNRFHAGTGWIPPDDFVPEDHLWYKVAVEANGEVGIVTEPYIDMALGVPVVTYSRRLFDMEGNQLGIVCLGTELDWIREYIFNMHFTESCGVLLSKQLEVLVHSDTTFWGKKLRDLGIGISSFADDFENGIPVSERKVINHHGKISIAFFRQINNDWFLGIVMPESMYFEDIRAMQLILVLLGSVLSLLLCFILIRITVEKQKADEHKQILLETSQLKIREAEASERTINNLKNILNGLDELIYVTVPETGEILFINNHMQKHYNIEGDCIGQICYKVFQVGMNQRCEFCPCNKLDKNPDDVVVWIEQSTITKRIYRNTDCYIEWPGGTIAHLQHSVDITELNDAKDQAVQARIAMTNFLARVSHEIRTPMNTVLGITEIQMQNEKLPSEIQEALGDIYNAGYLLLNIINDILDLSKIEAGKLELMPTSYNVASLINDTVHLNILWFDGKPIKFSLNVDENLPSVLFGDELRIKQILNNLLSNAFKYTDHGKVSLSFNAETQENADHITLVFRISDTGQGMTQEQLDDLFTEYARFNTMANRTIQGTGLGMSITKHLVQMMNGDIIVESEVSKGTVFTIRVPQKIINSGILGRELAGNLQHLSLSKTSQSDKVLHVAREYMPYGRVLIVDDVETNLYVASGLMAPYGLSIETADSGFEAIEKIKSGTTYDIIFMDHYMPKMDGIETTKIIRDMGYKHSIVVLTANAITGQAEMFLENGFDAFISKPIDLRQLNSTLNRLVRDKYPPEIIEAARKLKENVMKYSTGSALQPSTSSQLAETFVRDAKKAVATLEAIHANNYDRSNDIQMFIISVHSMKSALVNIGEPDLSDTASRLELAGRERDTDAMEKELPAFLSDLKAVIDKIGLNEDDVNVEIADGDKAFLSEKLLVIEKACAAYDNKTAREALVGLKVKTWPRPVKEMLNEIATHLLHSDFDEAAAIAKDFANK